MSKNEYIKSLDRELEKVNRLIDTKILEGKNYFIESRRHKFLLRQIKEYRGNVGFMSRFFSFL